MNVCDNAGAAKEYQAAYDITKDPRVFFNIARAYEKSGDAKTALVYYHRYVDEVKNAKDLDEVRGKGAESMKAAAGRFAANVLPIIQPLRAEGRSLREIADVLNARGVPTARGGKWAPTQIADILKRAR